MVKVISLPEVQAQTVGWDGGVNTRDAINQLAANEARLLENMVLDERGGATKRKGCLSRGTFGVGTDRGLMMHEMPRPGANSHVLMYTSAGKLYTTADITANPIVWIERATSLSTTQPFSFENFNNKVYMGNGVDSYASWDGTTYATYPTAPKGKFHRVWKDTMWISGVTGLADRIYSSAPGNAESWPASSWVDVGKGDGDSATAMASDGQFLIFGKRSRTFAVYDPVTFANRVVDFEKGIESHWAITQFEGTILFLSRRGVCRYLGDSPSQVISEKIDPLFSPSILALDKLHQATVFTYNNRVMFNLPEVAQSYNTLQIEYYPRLAGFTSFGGRGIGPWAFQRIPAQCFVRVRQGAADNLYGCKTTANKVLQLYADVGTDDGVAFSGTLRTGVFDLGSPNLTKYLQQLRFLVNGKFNCLIYRNFQSGIYRTIAVDATALQDLWDTSDVWGTGTWGLDSPLKELRKTNVDAYAKQFTFEFQDANETATGLQQVPVGAANKSLVSGEWAIYGLYMNGSLLGVRS